MYSVLCALTWRPMPTAARSKLCCRVSAWVGALFKNQDKSILKQIRYLKKYIYPSKSPLAFLEGFITNNLLKSNVTKDAHMMHCVSL